MNDGRWVALCDTPFCNQGEQVWADAPRVRRDGHPYGITSEGVLYCGNCGQLSTVEWPDDKNEIERLVAFRPVPQTRHWKPGETVAALKSENLKKGVTI